MNSKQLSVILFAALLAGVASQHIRSNGGGNGDPPAVAAAAAVIPAVGILPYGTGPYFITTLQAKDPKNHFVTVTFAPVNGTARQGWGTALLSEKGITFDFKWRRTDPTSGENTFISRISRTQNSSRTGRNLSSDLKSILGAFPQTKFYIVKGSGSDVILQNEGKVDILKLSLSPPPLPSQTSTTLAP